MKEDQKDTMEALAKFLKAFISLLFAFQSISAIYSKEYAIVLEENFLDKSIGSLVEADEFFFRSAIGKALFRENLDGMIIPELAKKLKHDPIDGKVEILFNRKYYWNNGKVIKPHDYFKFLVKFQPTNKHINNFFNCIEKNSLAYTEKSLNFIWKTGKSCTNLKELLAHRSFYFLDYNHHNTIAREYLQVASYLNGFKLKKSSINSFSIFHPKRNITFNFYFNYIYKISEPILYQRHVSILPSNENYINAGYLQTISFETNRLNTEQLTAARCLQRKLKSKLQNYKNLILASSYSLQTSQALEIKPNFQNIPTNCSLSKVPSLTVSNKFKEDFPEIIKILKNLQVPTTLMRHKAWKEIWFNEKINFTIRLQKVRTNNINGLFNSYFLSGIAPYKRIKKLIGRIRPENYRKYMKDSLDAINRKGYFLPIVHIPTIIKTTKDCSINGKADIYFDLFEYLNRCRKGRVENQI